MLKAAVGYKKFKTKKVKYKLQIEMKELKSPEVHYLEKENIYKLCVQLGE